MSNKENCESCEMVISGKKIFYCHSCHSYFCNNCILKGVCSDCGVNMCKNCRENGENKCGCYGNCYFCGIDVDRGNHGWPCYKCKKWYCSECKYKPTFNELNKCVECKMDND